MPAVTVMPAWFQLPSEPVVLNRQSTEGSAPTHLSVHPSDRHLLPADYGSGSVALSALGPVCESTQAANESKSGGSGVGAAEILA